MKLKIVFFGSGWYTIPVIEKLLEHGLNLVVTTEKNPESKFLKYCEAKNLKVLSVSNKQELLNCGSQITDNDVAILASFGGIIPDEIIEKFKYGILNIHPSLLPKYKGPSPIQYQLLNGETIVGTTIIKLDDQVDHGPIISQKPYTLQGTETSEDLLSILFEIGADLIFEQIIKLENGEELVKTPQDHGKEIWSYKITKHDGMIDMGNMQYTKSDIQKRVRAFYPWPGVWFKTNLKGQEKIVKLLPENKIQVEGKNPMDYSDFINGFLEEGKNLLQALNLI